MKITTTIDTFAIDEYGFIKEDSCIVVKNHSTCNDLVLITLDNADIKVCVRRKDLERALTNATNWD